MFRFSVISDPHIVKDKIENDTRLCKESIQIFRETIEDLGYLNLDLIIINGDVMEAKRYGFPALDLSFSEISKINTPCLVTIGNHDVRYKVTKDAYTKRDFIKKFNGYGPDGQNAYWVKKYNKLKLIVFGLDTTMEETSEGKVGPKQIEWLESELKIIPEDYNVIIFMHHPTVYFDGLIKKNIELKMYCLNNSDELQSLFNKYKVIKCVISGHNHVKRYKQLNGIHYIGMPSLNTWPNMYTIFEYDFDNLVFEHKIIRNKILLNKAKNKLFSGNSSWSKHFASSHNLKSYFSRGRNQRELKLN